MSHLGAKDFKNREDVRQEQADHLQKALYGDIEKSGGEGSKGGKVIGHTSTGKPIYGHYPHTIQNPHKHFTSEEHKEAAKLHHERREETLKEHFNAKGKKTNESDEEHESRKKQQIETARNGKDIGFLDKQREEHHLRFAKEKEDKVEKSEDEDLQKAYDTLGIISVNK